MESNTTNPEKDCGAIGVLFQTIINDLRGSSPIWEDFINKSMKLHTSLKSTMVAITSFLDAFQKVADMATGSKGATKEIGSALTRLCMRHKSIESNLQAFTSSIVNSLVAPLQDKLEDWKKAVATLDKDHAKEYKKAKQEIKKAASDTLRLQKKVKKGTGGHGKTDMQLKLDSAMQDVTVKYQQLEETEKNSVRSALIEERSRFCHFITCVKPFVDQELKLLTEINHIHEIMDNLCYQAAEPAALPASSEQVIRDLKGLDNSAWNFNQHPSPPSSPSSLGSRKSSMCSINSINSSSSGSSKSHSPSHTMHKRTPSQPLLGAIRLTSVSSQDSGFRSQDTLFHRPQTPQSLNLFQASSNQEKDGDDCDSTPTTPSDNTPSASSTWNNWPNPPGGPKIDPTRPHTISSAYEKGHGRPALKPDMFVPPAPLSSMGGGAPTSHQVEMRAKSSRSMSQAGHSNAHNRPSATISKMQPVLPPHSSKPKVKAVAPPMLPPGAQPIYANMSEISQRSSSQSEMSPDDGEPTTPTTPAGLSSVPQMQQDTSLELAKAIRELEASTAALTSAYDTDNFNNHPLPATSTSSAPSAGDADSYTSKISLPTSSGYGTMNSTPAGSEDTIASGDSAVAAGDEEDRFEVEKSFTLPRRGTGSAYYRPPIYPKRPASTTGIPLSGAVLNRRSSVNSQKPPPPVRRTASVAGTAPSHVQKLRSDTSPPAVGDGQYAELQLIQQSIHQQQPTQQQHYQQGPAPHYNQYPMAPPNSAPILRPGEINNRHPLNRTASYPAAPLGSMYSAPGENAVPTTTVIQSLNAKFASLNSQYQDDPHQQAPPGQMKALPPATMQKPKVMNTPAGPSASMMGGGGGGSQYAQPHAVDAATGGMIMMPAHANSQQYNNRHHYQQQHPQGHGHVPPHLAHQQQQQRNLQGQSQQQQQHLQSHYNNPHHQQHYQHQQQQQQQHYYHPNQQLIPPPPPPPTAEEDFPLPPTAEELQEIEQVYSRPPPINNANRGPPLMTQKPGQAKRPSVSGNPQASQQSLMMELKRRVSVDDTSEA